MYSKIARLCLTLFVLNVGSASIAFSQSNPSPWSSDTWKTNFNKSIVEFHEILTGNPFKDGIPSIDAPQFEPAKDNEILSDKEPVIAFSMNGDHRAYPLGHLMFHEIVNDEVGGVPVAVTYCPLCNTTAVYDRRLDGEATTFGTTGKLRHSDLVMYDRAEENWWQQFNGVALVGDRAGEKLEVYPSSLLSFGEFLERFPEGKLLLPDPRTASRVGTNPYVRYDSNNSPFLFRGQMPSDIDPIARVAMTHGDDPIAISLAYLGENAPVTVDGITFTWKAGQVSAVDDGLIARSQDIGTIEVFEGEEGNLTPIPYLVTFAFAARAFDPDLEIVQSDQ